MTGYDIHRIQIFVFVCMREIEIKRGQDDLGEPRGAKSPDFAQSGMSSKDGLVWGKWEGVDWHTWKPTGIVRGKAMEKHAAYKHYIKSPEEHKAFPFWPIQKHFCSAVRSYSKYESNWPAKPDNNTGP